MKWLFICVFSLALTSPLAGQTTVYEVDEPVSVYNWGCYPPCLCPLFFAGNLTGTFELTFNNFDGIFDNYDITNLNWSTDSPLSISITGTGTYKIDLAVTPPQQELVLDLVIDGDPHLLMTGLVAADVTFPLIAAEASENGFFCFDHAMIFTAQPVVSSDADFVRGDCNSDGSVNLADAIFGLDVLFGGGSATPECEDACDGSDDGALNIADMISILNALFAGQPLPAPSLCAQDPTPDLQGCVASGCP